MFKQILKNKGMNMDKELLRNGEGYVDPTAYNAMKKWEGVKMQLNPGDVINITMGVNNNYAMCFVVKDEKDYTEIVVAHKDVEYVGQNFCEIKLDIYGAERTLYIDAAKLSYVTHDRIKGRVSALSNEEREKMFGAIKNGLGLADTSKEQDVKSAYPDEDYLYDLEVAKAESRIYKELYENLLREVVGK